MSEPLPMPGGPHFLEFNSSLCPSSMLSERELFRFETSMCVSFVGWIVQVEGVALPRIAKPVWKLGCRMPIRLDVAEAAAIAKKSRKGRRERKLAKFHHSRGRWQIVKRFVSVVDGGCWYIEGQ